MRATAYRIWNSLEKREEISRMVERKQRLFAGPDHVQRVNLQQRT